MPHYDLIILGTGAVGGAALYHAARRGLRALGIDRFPPGHDRGSSHGESRLIRLSYIEHPDYVPMLRRSYELWDQLDPQLLQRSGLYYAGPEGCASLAGVLASAAEHHLQVDEARPGDFPEYRLPRAYRALFEPDAGWLPVERCVKTHVAQALDAGASHLWGESVLGWEERAGLITVRTEQREFSAARLIVSGGAWSSDLLPGLSLPLVVQRKHMHWFACEDPRYRSGFFVETDEGKFYGFPARDGTLKLGEHSGGEVVTDPLQVTRGEDPEDSARVENFAARFLPGVSHSRTAHDICFYTRSADEHFFVDRFPGSERVAFAAGLSGHGFKFAPVLGELLVQLVADGHTGLDIDFLSLYGRTTGSAPGIK
jgi:monomeric sarcosine oxidase